MMDFDAHKGETLVLLGQSKNFSADEISELLELDEITLSRNSDAIQKIVIAGRLLNPHLEAVIDSLELDPNIEVISIEAFESALSASIHHEGLFLSLKLSNDQTRILSYLKNSMLSDKTFISLLPLFDWKGEALLANDENRDLCAAITRRFYANIERNHNIEYSALGVYETAKATQNSELLDSLSQLEPIAHAYDKDHKDSAFLVLQAIAMNPDTGLETLKRLLEPKELRIARLVSAHAHIDHALFAVLEAFEDQEIAFYLAISDLSSDEQKLDYIKHYPEIKIEILHHISVSDQLFNTLLADDGYSQIAQNPALTLQMQQRILDQKTARWHRLLAQNPSLDQTIAEILLKEATIELSRALATNESLGKGVLRMLYALNDTEVYRALAYNSATPQELLTALSKRNEHEIVLGVAQNPSTAVETLYELFLDRRYVDSVKSNPSFGETIKEGIGW